MRIGQSPLYPARALLALGLGAVGAALATGLGLPIPILLGSLLAVGLFAIMGWQIAGCGPDLPQNLRLWFIPIVGVSIGGAFHPGLITEARAWWPSILGLALYVPLAHWLGYITYRRGGLDKATALFASVPGGLLESLAMGEQAGADLQMLTMLQFLRLIGCIVLVPLSFWLLTGQSVGSAAGTVMVGTGGPFTVWDVAVLLGAAALGVAAGRRIGLPGAIITGPVLASGLAHLTGLTGAVPPQALIQITQLIVGTSLGCRFAGMPSGALPKALGLAAVSVLLTLGLGYAMAAALHGAVGQKASTVFLAFAPGGVAEMSLVALSLHVSVVYVTAHHVLRIVLAVGVAQIAARRVLPGPAPPN